jgi:alginate O-acetyltransferase complex protein AlgJ
MRKSRNISDWFIIVLFASIICASLLLWIFLPDAKFSENEKRPLAAFPEKVAAENVEDYIERFEHYYQDHFGMREWMIRRYQREVSRRFGESGMPFAIEGKDGWLFYAMEGVLEDFQGELRFSEDEMNRFCLGVQAKGDWFAKQGILYIPLVAPNKQSIYEHKLKDSYRALQGDATRFDQVLDVCRNGPDSLLYDLRPELRKQSAYERGYAKTDTHWNEKGALLAYHYLMNTVQIDRPDFRFRKQFTFADIPFEAEGGDLAVLLGREELVTEIWPILPANELRIRIAKVSPEVTKYLVFPQLQPELYRGNPVAPRLLVLHDSFFNPLKAYVSVNFSESLYVWQFFDDQTMGVSGPQALRPIIEAFKPDIVIEEIVERHLEMLLESVDYGWDVVE